MTPAHLSATLLEICRHTWSALAPALGNHLWQSTLFAAAAGFLTLILRKEQARVRYWLWLAASAKFLIPFSILVTLGNRLASSKASAGSNAGLYFTVEEISQPFRQSAIALPAASQAATTFAAPSAFHFLPALLVAMWLCGFAAVVMVWCTRWRRISAAVRKGVPILEGREVEALRRVERRAGMRPIDMVRSHDSLEPGIFGIARPVLIWPEGISEHLEDTHLEAVLAHEVWHVRRRDNLAAALHMLVEAVFWFHPLVWWLGSRMLEAREHACDEEVVALSCERHIYAESILKVCEFCVGSPLACVSGVTGSDLKKRMVHIMTESMATKLNFGKKLLLGAVGTLAIALPIVFGLANAPQVRAQEQPQDAVAIALHYESVAIKSDKSGMHWQTVKLGPGELTVTNETLQMLIRHAYEVQDDQIAGAPDWLNLDRYDIKANLSQAAVDELQKLSPEQRDLEQRTMLQALLANKFKLAVHRETKIVPAYELVISENGTTLHESTNGVTNVEKRVVQVGSGRITGRAVPMSTLASLLSEQLGRAVIDKTGLANHYDVTLQWQAPVDPSSNESAKSAILTAVQEQLGLKLEPQTVPMEVVVIDHAAKPAEN